MFNLDTIKATIEAQQCPEHQAHPVLTIVDDGVSIAACCQPFHAQMSAMLESEIEASMNKMMEEAMKALE
ncbi:MAG: hypothetical protein ABI378_15805 [Chitinophagaceae bacterium]